MQEDAREIQQGKPYHWRDWSIIRGRDCLYIWSDAAALELSNGSNGWFRFILDGKLATMYSSGSPEGGSDSSGMTNTHTCNTHTLFYCCSYLLSHSFFLILFSLSSFFLFSFAPLSVYFLSLLLKFLFSSPHSPTSSSLLCPLTSFCLFSSLTCLSSHFAYSSSS